MSSTTDWTIGLQPSFGKHWMRWHRRAAASARSHAQTEPWLRRCSRPLKSAGAGQVGALDGDDLP
jgi:hypothetical protein